MQQHDFLESLIGLWVLDHAQEWRQAGTGADQIEIATVFQVVDDQRPGCLAADDDLVALLQMLEA